MPFHIFCGQKTLRLSAFAVNYKGVIMSQNYHYQNGPIESVSWGEFIVNGERHAKVGGRIIGCGKDIRLIGEQISAWKERKGHTLTNQMITGVFTDDVEILIIGTGFYGSLQCPDSVKEFILKNGIKKVIREKTPNACQIYNDLFARKQKVALLAHGTC